MYRCILTTVFSTYKRQWNANSTKRLPDPKEQSAMGTNSTRTQHWADYKYGGMMGDRGPRTPNNLDKAPRPTL